MWVMVRETPVPFVFQYFPSSIRPQKVLVWVHGSLDAPPVHRLTDCTTIEVLISGMYRVEA